MRRREVRSKAGSLAREEVKRWTERPSRNSTDYRRRAAEEGEGKEELRGVGPVSLEERQAAS